MAAERRPFTLVVSTSLFAAFYASLKNDRIPSYLFGGILLFTFLVDLLKNVPGGSMIVNWLMAW